VSSFPQNIKDDPYNKLYSIIYKNTSMVSGSDQSTIRSAAWIALTVGLIGWVVDSKNKTWPIVAGAGLVGLLIVGPT